MKLIKIAAVIIIAFMFFACSEDESVISNDIEEVSLEEVAYKPRIYCN